MIERMFTQWMQEFSCGCSEVQNKRRNLLGYCGTHGNEPRGKPYEVIVTPSTKLCTGQSR